MSATDRNTCTKALAAAEAKRGLRMDCLPEVCRHYLVCQRGDDIGTLTSIDAVKSWLGDIDTLTEAPLLVWADDHTIGNCHELRGGLCRQAKDGHRVIVEKMTKTCAPIEITRFVLHVDRDGTARVVESKTVGRRDSCI